MTEIRIALGVEYDGSHYRGWQKQPHDSETVQEYLEKALSSVAAHPVSVVCAGRTDTGVHGAGQVVHFDTRSSRTSKNWVYGANANLPPSISVRWAMPVSDKFHARFSAGSRRYRYIIYNCPVRPALQGNHMTWNYRPLNLERMKQAAACLVGSHDFSSYRAMGCQAKSPVRTVDYIALRRKENLIVLDIKANAFLQHMVRNIAGVLMTIGAGNRAPEWAGEVLEYRDRTRGGVTAPPYGLYFMGVDYPQGFQIPEPAENLHFMPLEP